MDYCFTVFFICSCTLVAFRAVVESQFDERRNRNLDLRFPPGDEVDLDDEDFVNAELVRTVEPDDKVLYKNGKFEGDMNVERIEDYLPPPIQKNLDPRIQNNAIRSRYRLWPRKTIPYKVSSSYSRSQRATIAAAMDEYHKRTCIKFVPQSDEDDYVYFVKDDGCYSSVGREGGRQIISIDNDCVYKGIIMHELMHTSGFFHEQSRTDRDENVDIKYENMIPGSEGQFRSYSSRTIDDLGTDYDYGSIMHYSAYAFSRNGRPTIVAKHNGPRMGQRESFSPTDIKKLRKLYQCEEDSGSTNGGSSSRRITINRPSPTRPTTSGGRGSLGSTVCVDVDFDRCQFYAGLGLCDRSSIVSDNCGISCGKCKQKPTVTSSRSNFNRGSNSNGSSSNRRTTNGNNRRSSTTSNRSSCKDTNNFCSLWKSRGFCTLDFVQSSCPVSCGNRC